MDYNTQSPPYPKNGGRGRIWKIIALAALFLCALPVLIPLSLCVAGGILVVALCAAGAVLAAVLCVAGGIFGLGMCVLAGLICLAALQIAALAGIGFGVVLLFQAPASGMAVLGASLFATGAGVLCWIVLWQLVRLLVRAFRALVNWTRRTFFSGRRRNTGKDHSGQEKACACDRENNGAKETENVKEEALKGGREHE